MATKSDEKSKTKLNFRILGLKAGLEIHQQLETKYKLFCRSSTQMLEKEPVEFVKRKQHAVAGELGKFDAATQFESIRDRTFTYQVFAKENCLVETDEEPPHELNLEALNIALQVAMLLNCEIPNELHVMRKTVTDGSDTSGFQRTILIGLNGFLKYNGKKIPITYINLEEDAAAIVGEENGSAVYRLNRLGVPLVEIGTGILENFTPEEIEDIAFQIGMICRSTSVKRGLGTIRQDVNVSIRGGMRCEIKGVQELSLLSKIVENEVHRQFSVTDLRNSLKRRGVKKVTAQPEDVTLLLRDTRSKVFKGMVDSGATIYAFKLSGFGGMMKREVSPGKTFGKELAEYVGIFGLKGIIHSDEDLVKYNAVADFEKLRQHFSAHNEDAIILIGENNTKGSVARKLIRRINEIFSGVDKEVRSANEDGTSRYIRPLPGSARLYPETDVIPMPLSKEFLEGIRTNLPEHWFKKFEKFKAKYKLSEDLARQMMESEKLALFEKIVAETKAEPIAVANTFTSTLKDLERRENIELKRIPERHYFDVFEALAKGKILKEALPELFKYFAEKPGDNITNAIVELSLEPISAAELGKMIKELADQSPNMKYDKAVGIIMSKVRGRIDAQEVMQAVKKFFK